MCLVHTGAVSNISDTFVKVLVIDQVTMSEGRFWLEEPCSIVANVTLLPSSSDTLGEQLNSLTRLTLVASGVLYAMKYKEWAVVLAISVAVIIVVWLMNRACKGKSEGFSVTPTYMSNDFEQTIVAPTYAEEWQIPPPAYEQYYDNPPEVEYVSDIKDPRSYPYGQYLTQYNLIPSDEEAMSYLSGGATIAREYANSSFLRHDLGFRENMTRLHKLKMARRFRNDRCNDTVSPYSSY